MFLNNARSGICLGRDVPLPVISRFPTAATYYGEQLSVLGMPHRVANNLAPTLLLLPIINASSVRSIGFLLLPNVHMRMIGTRRSNL